MRSNIETKNKLTLVSELGNESKFQILKYNELSGINISKCKYIILASYDNGATRNSLVNLDSSDANGSIAYSYETAIDTSARFAFVATSTTCKMRIPLSSLTIAK